MNAGKQIESQSRRASARWIFDRQAEQPEPYRRALIFACVGAIYLIQCLDLVNIKIDDVFITLRYSRNLLAGNGPVFNVGEAVEGYSNPTWLFLLTAIAAVTGLTSHLALFYLSKMLCVFFGALTLVTLYRLAKLRGNRSLTIFLLLIVTASSPFLNTHNISGMETSLVTFLLTLTVYLYVLWVERKTLLYALSFGVALGVLGISRPESVIYPIAIFAGILAVRKRQQEVVRYALFTVATVGLILCSFVGFRLVYYGEVAPNTLYAKNSPSLQVFSLGIHYAVAFLGMAVAPYALLALFKKSPVLLFRDAPLHLMIIAQFAFVIYSGGDWMPSFRLLTPALPLILFLLLDRVDVSAVAMEMVSSAIAITLLITGCLWLTQRDYIKATYPAPFDTGLGFQLDTYNSDFYSMALTLKRISQPGQSALIGEAGLIPYINDQLRFNDFFGLTDKHMAKDVKGAHFQRVDNDYFFSGRYDYVVVITRGGHLAEMDGKYHTDYYVVDAFVNDPRFSEMYRPIYRGNVGVIFKLSKRE